MVEKRSIREYIVRGEKLFTKEEKGLCLLTCFKN